MPYESLFFKNLKSLTIASDYSCYTHILNNLAISNEALEVFEFEWLRWPNMVDHANETNPLIKYKNLKKIRLNSDFYNFDNLTMLQDLPKLEEVKLKENSRSLDDIISIARNSKALKLLQCDIDGSNMQFGLKFYKKFCSDFANRHDLLIKIIETNISEQIVLSKFQTTLSFDLNGVKRVKY